MNNLKISTRLTGAFGLLVVLLLTVAISALLQLRNLHEDVQEINTNWLPSVQAVGTVDSQMANLRLMVLTHVMTTDDAGIAALDREIEAGRAQLGEARKRYEKLISSPEEQKLYDEFSANWTKYVEINNRALALSRKNDNAAAAEIMNKESKPLYLVNKGLMDKLVKLNADGSAKAAEESAATYASARNVLVSVSVVAVLMAVVIAAWLIRSITAPLAKAVEVADRVAGGDLTGEITIRSMDETGLLLGALQRMQQSLVRTVSAVRNNAEGVASASAQIASGNNDLSARTEEQASALEQTAASMEELGSTVRQNADNARAANQLAVSASTVAVQGGDVVAEVVETMKGINASSAKIADIISVIDGIAFQTNILALNAAVEAARAGEQGRGFAVVAGEVRSLASRSAEAAKEIKALITASVERVEQGSLLVDKAGTTMAEVVTAIRRVTDIMGEISAASSEQSAGVGQVGEAVTQMDQATQQNAALVEEMAAAASALNAQAGELVQAVAVFKLDASAAAGVAAPSTAGPMAAPLRAVPAAAGTRLSGPAPARGAVATKAPVAQGAAGAGLRSATAASAAKPLATLAAPVARTAAAAPGAPSRASSKATAAPAAAVAPKPGRDDDDWESF